MSTHKPFTETDRKLAHQLSRKLERLILPTQIKPLRRAAMTYHHLLECECNGAIREKSPSESWNDYDESRNKYQIPWIEKRMQTIEKRIDTLCKELNIKYYIQTDCRGGTLYLGTDSDTNYNNEGVLIY